MLQQHREQKTVFTFHIFNEQYIFVLFWNKVCNKRVKKKWCKPVKIYEEQVVVQVYKK